MQLDTLPLDKLTPGRLWSELDPETRKLAARAVYDTDVEDASPRADADRAIAATLRFRDVTVKRLSVEKRVDYLVRVVRPDEALAVTLLTALHLRRRRGLLSAFLDELGIPHRDGLIDERHEVGTFDTDRLAAAVASLRARFDAAEVDLYLASLLAMDPLIWAPLASIVRRPAD